MPHAHKCQIQQNDSSTTRFSSRFSSHVEKCLCLMTSESDYVSGSVCPNRAYRTVGIF